MVTYHFCVVWVIYEHGGLQETFALHIVVEMGLGHAEIKQFACIIESVFGDLTTGPHWFYSVKLDVDGFGFLIDSIFFKSRDVNSLMVHEQDEVRARYIVFTFLPAGVQRRFVVVVS